MSANAPRLGFNGNATLTLTVIRRVQETPDIVSVCLALPDGQPLPAYRAGQHLVLEIPGVAGAPVRRTYTLSGAPSVRDHYRLTVKLERCPRDRTDLPDGIGSSAVHGLAVGMTVRCLPPRGTFVLDDSDRPVVLMAGGVGITPLIAMLAELAMAPKPRQPVWLLHACRSPEDRALAAEAEAWAARHGRARVIEFAETGVVGSGTRRAGRITMDALRDILPFDDYSFYLCGPLPFMDALHEGLRRLNVAADRIRWESFGARPAFALARPDAELAGKAAGPGVDFAGSAISGRFADHDVTLLGTARRLGVDVVTSCEEGVCGTCRCRLLSGEIEYVSDPIAWLEDGEILPCISRPRTDVVMDA